MGPQVLRAHYDGKQVRLDEPCDLEPNTDLLVIVLNDQNRGETDREDWARFSSLALGHAYGEDEPEYSIQAVIKPNPDYDGR